VDDSQIGAVPVVEAVARVDAQKLDLATECGVGWAQEGGTTEQLGSPVQNLEGEADLDLVGFGRSCYSQSSQ
jgi:hypothetical protein